MLVHVRDDCIPTPNAVFAICMCASPKVGGCQGGHGKVEYLFGTVRVLCHAVQKHTLGGSIENVSQCLPHPCLHHRRFRHPHLVDVAKHVHTRTHSRFQCAFLECVALDFRVFSGTR